MNLADIRERLKHIEEVCEDNEKAHLLEDGLYYDFVDSIANERFTGDLSEAAMLVLTSTEISFNRWYA